MRIQELALPEGTDTVYVVGSGPSLRCLPMSFFKDKITVGLNQAWRHLDTTYSITVHPELVVEYDKIHLNARTQWIIKKKPPMAHLELDNPAYYVFGTSYDVQTVVTRPKDTLYLGEGVQTTAMDLAARMGAKHVVLVGCDAASLGGDFHAHDQHVRWLGLKADEQYALYRQKTAETRAALRGVGVSVMTLTPFIGATGAVEDYARLRKELKLDPLPKPKDISPYTRKHPNKKK